MGNVVRFRKARHQLGTLALDDIPVTLYQRDDVKSTTWQMRIKLPGENKYIRKSTGETNMDRAEAVARKRYIEATVLQEHGIPILPKRLRPSLKRCWQSSGHRECQLDRRCA